VEREHVRAPPISPLLCLPSSAHKLANSAKLTYASRVSEKEDEVEEATCVEAAEEEACRRLVELVDVHVTILRVVAADVQGALKF